MRDSPKMRINEVTYQGINWINPYPANVENIASS